MPPSTGRVPAARSPQLGAQGLRPGRGSPLCLLVLSFQGAGGHDHPKLQVRRLRPLALVLILSLYLKKKKLNIFFYSFKKNSLLEYSGLTTLCVSS